MCITPWMKICYTFLFPRNCSITLLSILSSLSAISVSLHWISTYLVWNEDFFQVWEWGRTEAYSSSNSRFQHTLLHVSDNACWLVQVLNSSWPFVIPNYCPPLYLRKRQRRYKKLLLNVMSACHCCPQCIFNTCNSVTKLSVGLLTMMSSKISIIQAPWDWGCP